VEEDLMKIQVGIRRLYNPNFSDRKDVVLWDVLNVEDGQKIKINFIKNNTNYRQGIRIAVDVGKGELEIFGIKSREMELWEDTAPEEVICSCSAKSGKISIYNIWDDQGFSESQCDSSGMILEEKENKVIYHCNDYGFETNFEKFVFAIERLWK
jgi:hypothetical protein